MTTEKLTIRKWTMEEALERAVMPPPTYAASRERRAGWAGPEFDDAIRMAAEGDPKNALGIDKHLGVLSRIRHANRSITRWGEAGSSVDVGQFMSGEPDCMMETVRARRPSPVLRIAVERAVPHTVSAEEMRATGASVLAVVEALRTAGIPSEIWVTYSIAGWSGHTLSTQVLVQEAGRPINLDVLAFWVVNPASFRRIGFAVEEQEPEDVKSECGINSGGGYGHPVPTPKDDFDEVAPAFAHQASEWIREVLGRRAGVQVFDEF